MKTTGLIDNLERNYGGSPPPATTEEADVAPDTDKLRVPRQMKVGESRETLHTSIMPQRGGRHSKNLAESRLK